MRSVRHGFKRSERKRSGTTGPHQNRRLVDQDFIDQAGFELGAAEPRACLYLDFIDLHLSQAGHQGGEIR